MCGSIYLLDPAANCHARSFAVKTPSGFGARFILDFNRHQTKAGRINQQVDFGTVTAAVKTRLRIAWRSVEQSHDRKPFSTVAYHRVRQLGRG